MNEVTQASIHSQLNNRLQALRAAVYRNALIARFKNYSGRMDEKTHWTIYNLLNPADPTKGKPLSGGASGLDRRPLGLDAPSVGGVSTALATRDSDFEVNIGAGTVATGGRDAQGMYFRTDADGNIVYGTGKQAQPGETKDKTLDAAAVTAFLAAVQQLPKADKEAWEKLYATEERVVLLATRALEKRGEDREYRVIALEQRARIEQASKNPALQKKLDAEIDLLDAESNYSARLSAAENAIRAYRAVRGDPTTLVASEHNASYQKRVKDGQQKQLKLSPEAQAAHLAMSNTNEKNEQVAYANLRQAKAVLAVVEKEIAQTLNTMNRDKKGISAVDANKTISGEEVEGFQVRGTRGRVGTRTGLEQARASLPQLEANIATAQAAYKTAKAESAARLKAFTREQNTLIKYEDRAPNIDKYNATRNDPDKFYYNSFRQVLNNSPKGSAAAAGYNFLQIFFRSLNKAYSGSGAVTTNIEYGKPSEYLVGKNPPSQQQLDKLNGMIMADVRARLGGAPSGKLAENRQEMETYLVNVIGAPADKVADYKERGDLMYSFKMLRDIRAFLSISKSYKGKQNTGHIAGVVKNNMARYFRGM